MDEDKMRTEIRQFVLSELLMGDATAMPEDGESLLESGAVDSTGVLEVVMFLEGTYKIKVLDRELVPENLDSIDRLTEFVKRKTHAA
jgi:acyl carrier protein